jgi:acyl dehydratase
MTRRTFDDVTAGDRIDCGTASTTREEILEFGRRWDPLAIHTDPDAAADSPFGDVIASGIHTFALTQPPVVEAFYGNSDMVASGRIEELRFPAPVRPGDTLAVELEVLEARGSERNDRRGVVTTRRSATVEGETVLELRNRTIWAR